MKLPRVIAFTGLLAASLAHAQSVQVDANGNVNVDADGARVEVDGGAANVSTRSGVQARTQNISSKLGNTRITGDNIQRINIRGRRVNVAGGGGTAISTIAGHTTVSAPMGGVGYVNGELDGSNFSGRN